MKNRICSYVYESGEECGRRHLARGYCELHYKRWLHGASMGAAIEEHVHPHRVQILRQEAPRQRPLQDPLHPRTERREEYGPPYPETAKDEEMSGPPYALQRLPAIINFSGGRSSAFMLGWKQLKGPLFVRS